MSMQGVDPEEGGGARARFSGGVIASLCGLGLLVVFMLQNTERVAVTFLFWEVDWPLWLVTLGAALLGAVIWIGVSAVRRRRRRSSKPSD